MSKFSGQNFNSIQLSRNRFVDNKKFENCNFQQCNLADYSFTNCEFEDCVFIDCNFRDAALALNRGYKSGKFLKCIFNSCDLKAASFWFPVIDHCEFRNCYLSETIFDGSRFYNTKFIGELDSSFFNGYSTFAKKRSLLSFKAIDPLKVPNLMVNVDFSQSRLIGVSFAHKIDLEKCIFPKGEEYVFVTDLKKTMPRVIEVIKRDWSEYHEKDIAIGLVEDCYFGKDMREQKSGFFDSFIPQDLDAKAGNDTGMRLFNLIKRVNSENNP